MQTSIEAIGGMEDKADCAEKMLYWKWVRVTEIQTGEAI